jgi:hypothetical protein
MTAVSVAEASIIITPPSSYKRKHPSINSHPSDYIDRTFEVGAKELGKTLGRMGNELYGNGGVESRKQADAECQQQDTDRNTDKMTIQRED